jgi:hypothetical protein
MSLLTILIGLVAVAGTLVLTAAVYRHRLVTRTRILGEILDLADRSERDLHECRTRLREVPSLVKAWSGSSEVSARATLAAEPEVQAGLRELLAHRLWLKDHGATASLAELRRARDALARAQSALSGQIGELAAARDDLERACEAVSETQQLAGSPRR